MGQVQESGIPALSKIILHCSLDGSTSESRENVLKMIQRKMKEEVLCTEGQTIALNQTVGISIAECEPFSSGRWTRDTELELVFKSDAEGDRSFINLTQFQKIFAFSYQLVRIYNRKDSSYRKIFQSSLERVLEDFGSHQFREIPSEVVCDLVKNVQPDKISIEGTPLDPVILNSKIQTTLNFLNVTSFSDNYSFVLPVIFSSLVEPGYLFTSPALLKSLELALKIDNLREFLNRKFIVRPLPKNPEVVPVKNLELSSLHCHLLNEMSTQDVDSILSEFFRQPRFFSKLTESSTIGRIFEVNIFDYLTPSTEHLRWSIRSKNSNGSLYFKMETFEAPKSCSVLLVSNVQTRLMLNARSVFQPLPNVTKTVPCCQDFHQKITIFDNLPLMLSRERDHLCRLMPDDRFERGQNVLCFGHPGCGKNQIYSSLSLSTGLPLISYDCGLILGESSGVTEKSLKRTFAQIRDEIPCILVLRNIEILSRNRDGDRDDRVLSSLTEEIRQFESFLIGDTNMSPGSGEIDQQLAGIFQCHVDFGREKPGNEKSARYKTLEWILRCHFGKKCLDEENALDYLSQRTAGFLFEDLKGLVTHAVNHSSQRFLENYSSISENFFKDFKLARGDFDSAFKHFDEIMSANIGAPKIPSVNWKDVGGLEKTKKEILDTIQIPLLHPDLTASGLKRSGILMYGPPGVGKTLLAKAVATECSLNFLSVKGPELLNMYVGQSEANVRDVFRRARQASPCVIFFDELDSLAPNRGRSGDSGGVMDRVVSQLLAELDGLQGSSQDKQVFVIGATNRSDLIDSALLRPGRFDRLVYIGLPSGNAEKVRILEAITRKFNLASDNDEEIKDVMTRKTFLEQIVRILSNKNLSALTGADFYALCSDAMLNAMARLIRSLEEKMVEKCPKGTVFVRIEDFEAAASKLVPSVSKEDLKYYEKFSS